MFISVTWSVAKTWNVVIGRIVLIPHDVQCFLQLEENFTLPNKNKGRILFECIKNIEHNTRKFPIDKRIEITNHSIPILNDLVNTPIFTTPNDENLFRLKKDTKEFTVSHPNIIFTRADKGNVTVALDKDIYILKIKDMLSDNETYTEIQRDPTNKLTKSLTDMLTR